KLPSPSPIGRRRARRAPPARDGEKGRGSRWRRSPPKGGHLREFGSPPAARPPAAASAAPPPRGGAARAPRSRRSEARRASSSFGPPAQRGARRSASGSG